MNFRWVNIWVLLAFGLFLPGCANQKKRLKKLNKRVNCYTLTVSGVECALCAKKAILALEAIPNVQKVEFICNDAHYDDCFAKMYIKNQQAQVSVDEIKNKLLEVGFELDSLSVS